MILVPLVFIAIVVLFSMSICIVKQGYARIVERNGRYDRCLDSGIHMIVPFVDKVSPPISLKEDFMCIRNQKITMRNGDVLNTDISVFFKITHPKLFKYGTANTYGSLEMLANQVARSVMLQYIPHEFIQKRELIYRDIMNKCNEATGAWGIKILRIEVTVV